AQTEGAPSGRRVLLNKLEERLIFDDTEIGLSCNIYPDTCHPQGYRYLVDFQRRPWPTFTWETQELCLRKEIFMPHGQNRTVIRYTLLDAPEATWLAVNPLVSGRDYHHLMESNISINASLEHSAEHFCIQPYDEASRVCLWFGDGHLTRGTDGLPGEWYYDFIYPVETRRGLDDTEDLYCPGEIRWLLHPGQSATVVAGCRPMEDLDVEELAAGERRRRTELTTTDAGDDIQQQLHLAANQFIIDRPGGKSVIAGYPWFTDWGRDTMISLPGLTIATKRYADCRDILQTYLANMHNGLIPNLFPDAAEKPAYNTCDATLWMFAAARNYYAATRDLDFFAGEVYETMKSSIHSHIEGTSFNIGMDTADGLLHAGDADTQLTWMDAKVGGWVVTPRQGRPVEINALWYNALRTVDFLAGKFDDTQTQSELGELAGEVRASFVDTFFDDELGYCYDVIGPDGPDASLRPNQLIAGALTYRLLSDEQLLSILEIVRQKLLTPFGLRTLSPDDPAYQGHYEGDQYSRDGAYHQGTVWPWLIGPYCRTYFTAHGVNDESRDHVSSVIRPLIEYLQAHGSIPEIFDGDEPHYARGCIAQAWSVAAVLECYRRVQ
ncbi:MAG: amylo-alpha-1,6-glucosidase, partial [Armatimonadota bacterium]